MTDLVAQALSLARAEAGKGVRESGGKNRGPEIDGYCRDCRHDPAKGDPWCALFVSAMFLRAARALGAHMPFIPTAGVFTLEEKAPPEVHTDRPAPGAIFITKKHKHTGLVLSVSDDGQTIETVEGNTNPAGSPDGDGVYARTRKVGEIMIYLDYSRYEEKAVA